MKSIVTERLVLRPFEADDLDAVVACLSDPEVMRFSLEGPCDRERCIEFIGWCRRRYEEPGYGLMAVTIKEKGTVIGYCGLDDHEIDGVSEVEVGYRLNRVYWGQGFATEAARAIRDFAFADLGRQRLISIIEAANVASIRVAEKNGMQYEKDSVFREVIPVRIYAMAR